MSVSMTWPEYLAGCCRIDGRLTRLTLKEADVLLALLLGNPDWSTPAALLIETAWDNASCQPLESRRILRIYIRLLRKRGIVIERRAHWSYRISREARSQTPPKPGAAMRLDERRRSSTWARYEPPPACSGPVKNPVDIRCT